MEEKTLEYIINSDDVVTHVSETWDDFAEENGGEGLGERVVGTWLWQHFSGREIKHLFQVLLERVRSEQITVRVPFRCDAPELRRFMFLEVTPQGEGAIRFRSSIQQEEPRPKVHLLEAKRPEASEAFLRMCAWCKRVDVGRGDGDESASGAGGWQEVEVALSELELLTTHPLPRITHGVCRDCRELVLSELAEAG
ncbi:MAG: hypothetical protein HKO65_00315 [Gemmatimonadetes bacterium]|nr:hypothetical protein [Gemmatimonadota bacterium]NNM03516.1 hypothetical protein [Gemmatimonadota bacterium]